MTRCLAVVWAIIVAASCPAYPQGADEQYVRIYHLIQEADNLNDAGRVRDAVGRYMEAQNALKSFQAAHPDWNQRIVKFRLEYIAARLQPLPHDLPGTNAPTVVATVTPGPAGSSLTNQLNDLQAEIARLTRDNAILEAKLKEALSVQPPAGAQEMARAEERIRQLQKERDLLKVALDQQQGTAMKLTDPAAMESERKLIAGLQEKLNNQTALSERLQKENDDLKQQIASLKPLNGTPSGGKNELGSQLQLARATIASLQASNLALRSAQVAMEKKPAEAAKAAPPDIQRQLALALARLEVYEARQVPYSPEELALIKQPDTRVSMSATNAFARRSRELPPGTGPLMDEARRATESGRFEDAEKKLQDILRQDEKNVYVLGTLAQLQMDMKRTAEAEANLQKLLSIDPQDPAGRLTLGILRFQQGKHDEAADNLSLTAKMTPDDWRAQYFLGKALLEKGMRPQGEAALRKAISLRPGWGEAHYSLAMVYATQQPPFKELAQWHYQKALLGGYPRNQDFERLLAAKGNP